MTFALALFSLIPATPQPVGQNTAGRPELISDRAARKEKLGDAPSPKENGGLIATPAQKSAGARFGMAFITSTLGLGPTAVFRAIPALNLRLGFNMFRYGTTRSSDGVDYHGVLRLRSLNVIADWYPFPGDFHVSGGLLFYNGNRITAAGAPPTGTVLTVGSENFISDPHNPIVGSAKSEMKLIAPMLLIGFGNLLPRARHFGWSIDVGVAYQGHPQSSFALTGGACDPTGQYCGSIAGDSNIQAAATTARSDLEKGVSFLRYYPLLSIGFSYHF